MITSITGKNSDLTKKTKSELIHIIKHLENRHKALIESDTKHEKTLHLLNESRQKFETLTDNLAVGIYRRTPGPDGRLIMVNSACIDMFGYDSEEEILNTPIHELYWDKKDCDHFSSGMAQDNRMLRKELKMKTRDCSPIWVSVTATAVRNKDGKVEYFDGIMEDITERKKVELENKLHQKQLMQADKMITLGILASGIAHEINNPNQFITSHIVPLKKCFNDILPVLEEYYRENGDFLMGGEKYTIRKSQIQEMFTNITKGTERIKNIVNELRDYAREHPLENLDSVDVNSVVKSALSLLGNLIKKSTSNFSCTYAKNIPLIYGDYQGLEQVIINLIQNSCQSLPDKKCRVSVNTEFNKKDGLVIITVSDQGSGISQENIEYITDPFFTTKRREGGTGLGLSISASIIKKHNGNLEFDSEPGKGTIAKVKLPLPEKP